MAEAEKKAAGSESAAEKVKKKKLRPTNCVQSNKRIRRKDWYYRDGNYFASKAAYKLWATAQQAEKAKKAAEKQAAEAQAAAGEKAAG
ncbi:MAG: hypothetical protein MOGMAGMI_00915 [Candidatus Omnitrophica bacterium]|nr:hypothetical protein [Candidatus Omnitrophota bacterium]